MEKSESIKNLAMALNKAQGEMGGAKKTENNPFFKSKYSDLKEVIKAIKKPFADNGLSYVQFPIEDNSRIGIETMLMHSSGEWLSNSFTVQLTKQDAQGAGSAITYCRRYGLQAVSGVPSEDDDGNHASPQQTETNKDNNQDNNQDVNWYNTFDQDRLAMISDIRAGKTSDDIIKSLQVQGLAINKKIREQIKGLK